MVLTSIGIFIGIMLIRLLLYMDKMIRLTKYQKKYYQFLSDHNQDFVRHKRQIIQLFNEAGLPDPVISRIEPAGYSQLKTYSISGFENITVIDNEIIGHMRPKFQEGIGVFKHRMIQSINPIFWIEFIVKFPEMMFKYVGVLPENILVKIINILYWIVLGLLGLKKLNILDLPIGQ
jgi:hypothetical protein